MGCENPRMNLREEAKDFEAAGALADELPWWGWLPDGECLLGRNGNLIAVGRLTPAPVDGRAPVQLDRVIDRWQRALSNLDDKMRLYFYFLRRPPEIPKPASATPARLSACPSSAGASSWPAAYPMYPSTLPGAASRGFKRPAPRSTAE